MRIGVFAKTFRRPTLEATLDAVAAAGIECVQYNLACAGLPTLPESIEPTLCDRIAAACSGRGLTISAISGTFNMIHPDPARRREGLARLDVLAGACRRLGTATITLCTGTRHPDDMWRWHPANIEEDAWRDLVVSMTRALEIAEQHDVALAFEPEVANVVHSASGAQRLYGMLGGPHPRLKVVIDPANLFHAGDLPRMAEVLDDAFERLGPHIVLAHAKDLDRDGAAGDVPAGRGCLEYARYVAGLRRVGYDGPLILHGLDEEDVEASVAFLRRAIAESG